MNTNFIYYDTAKQKYIVGNTNENIYDNIIIQVDF